MGKTVRPAEQLAFSLQIWPRAQLIQKEVEVSVAEPVSQTLNWLLENVDSSYRTFSSVARHCHTLYPTKAYYMEIWRDAVTDCWPINQHTNLHPNTHMFSGTVRVCRVWNVNCDILDSLITQVIGWAELSLICPFQFCFISKRLIKWVSGFFTSACPLFSVSYSTALTHLETFVILKIT